MQDGLGLPQGQAEAGFVAASLGEMGGAWLAMSLVGRYGRAVPQAGALLAAATLSGYHYLITAKAPAWEPCRPRPRRSPSASALA
ncbi:hypothetical protein [Streptomyces iconiensis]|uniref:Major facilitator superfamily (MFS) profile domain-containing protein n=1 Tax=Streptomyces iconiensis TaxID=1384038 RepID=A0ABT7A669_9ACTN|nr:hypothetical protein [Streptomyces iconiensis]MDJ1136825.1 hypothetical protein [Streptomyces iconiensis]